MGGGVPASTTSTTTVNQSPWQNPTYQALMLGTKDRPGPITNILRSNQGYMDAYNRMLGQGITPADIVNSGKYNPSASSPGVTFQNQAPTQTAADGGVMSLQGYAPGGATTKSLSPAQVAAVNKYNNLVAQGQTPPDSLITQLNNIEKATNRNVSPFVDSGIAAVGNTAVQNSIAKAAASGNYPKDIAGTSPYADVAQIYPNSGAVRTYDKAQKATADKAAADAVAAKDSDARQRILEQSLGQTAGIRKNAQGEFESTNPVFNQVMQELQAAQKLPNQFGQATDAYNTAIKKLEGMTNYQAQDVMGKDAQAAAMQAASMQGREAQAAAMQAASMQAAQANRGDIRDIKAIQADVDKYAAAGMQAPPALQAEAYQAAQMQGAQLQGPKSWTDEGTAQKYMSPYQQNVTDIAKRESMRDFGKQLAQLRSQATGQKAFGGTRAALQESEARRGQAQRMSDIEAQGLNEAYKSGMGQFSAEQGLGLQAGQSNLQAALTMQQQNQAATNAQRQMYVQQALDAAKTSYGGELTAAQQNQIAQNAAAQFNSQSQNTAYNNYVAQQLAASQANQGMDWNTVNLNTQNQQAAALANAQFQQQAAQLNAQNQQQAELANQQYGLGGFQSNLNNAQLQQQAAQLNAQNQQQANLANQLYGVGGFNAQQANQQAGLQANQQNLGALGQSLSGAQGLGALGASQAQTNLANIGALGQGASAWQNLMQQYLNTQSNNAFNTINFPSNLQGPVMSAINAQPTQGGSSTTTGTASSATPFGGRAKGGSVEAHKEWDKAKGGNTVKKGIASKGWA